MAIAGHTSAAADDHQVVRLEVPMAPESIRLARLLATGIAAGLDLTVDELEDVAIAVDELCFVLIGPSSQDETVELSFTVGADGLMVEGAAPDVGQPGSPSRLSARIISATVDTFEVWRDANAVRFRLTCGAHSRLEEV